MKHTSIVVSCLVAAVLALAAPAEAQTYAYVLGRPASSPGAQKVTVIDVATLRIVTTLTAGAGCNCVGPDKIAVRPDGSRIFVANEMDSTVTVFDGATLSALAPITAVAFPTAVTVSPDGTKLYVLHSSSGTNEGRVSVYNAATSAFITSIVLGNPLFARAMTVSPNGSRLYVSTYNQNTIKVIDTSSNTVLTTIAGGVAGAWMLGMDVSPDGATLYVVNTIGNSTSLYSTATNTFINSVATGGAAESVRAGADGAWLYLPFQNSLRVSNSQTLSTIGTIALGTPTFPRAIELTPGGSRVLIATDPEKLQIFSPTTGTIVATLTLPVATHGSPGGIAIVGAAAPAVNFNDDAFGDVFVYQTASGLWSRETGTSDGNFVDHPGGWSPDWTVAAARFNTDPHTDMFVFNQTTGQWFVLAENGSGFDAIGTGAWSPVWQRYIGDLNGDGLSDVFLYDPVSGQWFKCLWTPGGFVYHQGGWSPGWEIVPMRLDTDARQDFLLFNRTSGQGFWATSDAAGDFSYPRMGFWSTVWNLYPGDFNGDGVSDLLLHDPASGQWFVAMNINGAFQYHFGTWSLGWTPYVADLDGDGRDDLFLIDHTSGQWFHMISNGVGGFTNVGGSFWTLGWQLHFVDLNSDRRADVLLYNNSTGQWFHARSTGPGTFSYTNAGWAPGVRVVVK